jgi:hypothetical protein
MSHLSPQRLRRLDSGVSLSDIMTFKNEVMNVAFDSLMVDSRGSLFR